MLPKLQCYECEEDECNSVSLRICKHAHMCWTVSVREEDGTKRYSRGCILNREQVPFYCRTKRRFGVKRDSPLLLMECCKTNLCNNASFTPLPDIPRNLIESEETQDLLMVLLPALVVLILLLSSFVSYMCIRRINKREHSSNNSSAENDVELGGNLKKDTAPTKAILGNFKDESTLRRIVKEEMTGRCMTSGSGFGKPRLSRKTIAKQISLLKCLTVNTTGYFNRAIWRGVRLGEDVAVKVYTTLDEALWIRETEVFTQLLPSKADNILGYFGSDIIYHAGSIELWIVNSYCSQGSLRSYLKRSSKALNYRQMLNMCLNISSGLLYLHTEVSGTRESHLGRIDTKKLSKRYTSPELLKDDYDPQHLEGFHRADMYSLGLVFWELCRRCISNGVALDYEAAYAEWLEADNQKPTLEDMRKLVVDEKRRPTIPNHWRYDTTMRAMGILMQECWRMKPASRLPVLRVKKTVIKLARNNCVELNNLDSIC